MLIVEESYENLVATDRLIIKKINQHPDAFINSSIVEFAKNVSTAVSTISKFVRRLGFTNYREFQNYLITSYLLEREKNYSDFLFQIKRDEEIENLKKIEFYAIEETIKLLDQRQLKNVAQRICEANKIWLIGSGQNFLQLQDLCNNLRIVGCNAFATSFPNNHAFEIMNLDSDDLVIFMADNYESNVYFNLVRKLKENHVTLVMITALNKFFINDMDFILNYFAFPLKSTPSLVGNTKVQSFFLNNLIMTYILKQKSTNPNWTNPKRW
ncbi:RpiR family transcriptional regulator [Entomoplasma freundtii]|uniref:RpiR family transcriptional regulator n=1 Tax=Entomoplasma freundtii TaxID=74700 RepID=A0A2K8NS38_9MOLU|nr:MurR/RpiR family transcriptional regulator [Entomoplasma freundtii]ATZ16366.1 RpiR family transcriptional regulator [Entomoplasma freundtii]TDY56595.1 RpiR family transcriptional regulator [Entomoplasma freundtii]